MRNTWRGAKISEEPRPFKVKQIEVLWETKNDLVWAEIATLLGTDTADSNTPHWFTKRMKALKNVYERLTEEEKIELQGECNRRELEGNPEEVKRK